MHQRLKRGLAGNHRISDLFYATWAKTIRFARKTQRWRRPFVRLQKWSWCPGRTNSLAFRQARIDGLKCFPCNVRKIGDEFGTRNTVQLALFFFATTEIITKQGLSLLYSAANSRYLLQTKEFFETPRHTSTC